jgi:hypothetical protein
MIRGASVMARPAKSLEPGSGTAGAGLLLCKL